MGTVLGRPLVRPGDIRADKLQGWWKFDEASGNRSDSSGNGVTLTDVNTVTTFASDYWVSGEVSADFDSGNSEHFTGGDNIDLNGTDFTIACWIKPDDTTDVTICGKGSTAVRGYTFSIGTNILELSCEAEQDSGTASLTIGKWQHVAAVKDTTANTITFYIDGNVDAVKSNTATITDVADVLVVGARPVDQASLFYDGSMKDLAIWNAALTPLQIKSLALGQDLSRTTFRPDHGSLPTPTVYYKLNETVASGQRNDSIGSLHLTDNGTVPTTGGYIEGAAPDMDGSSDYFDASDNTAFDLSGRIWTIAFWMKANSATTADGLYGQTTNAGNYFNISIDNTASLLVEEVVSSASAPKLESSIALESNTWYHAAFTQNGNTWKIYIDGKEDTSASFTFGDGTETIANHTGNINVGAGGSTSGSNPFGGQLADFAIWKGTALSATQIASLACGLDINKQGVVSHWKCNDSANAAFADAFANNNLTDANSSVASVSGQVGNGRDFESAGSDHATITDASQTNLEPSYLTWAAWVNPDTNGTAKYLFNKNRSGNDRLDILRNASNELSFEIGNNTTTTAPTSTSTTTAGTFFHGICVYDGAEAHVYYDSVKEDSHTLAGTFPGNSSDVFVGSDDGVSNFSDLILDEMVFFQRAIGEEEAKALYLKGYNAKEATSSELSASGLIAALQPF